MPRVLIAGCGDLGNGLGRWLAESEWEVWGLRRNTAALAPEIRPFAADLLQRETLNGLPQCTALIYTATPSARTESAYRAAYVTGLQHVLAALTTPVQRLIYVSSTSVLADNGGDWVDEDTAPSELSPTAAVLHEAEQRVQAAGGVVLRLAGIYGPGREWLLRQAREADLRCEIDPPQWTNRIHTYDCVSALAHLLRLAQTAALYHGVDDCPAPRYEVLSWLRQHLGLPPPLPGASAVPPGSTVLPAGGKRIRNHRLRASGWQPHYPDYRAGYGAILAQADRAESAQL